MATPASTPSPAPYRVDLQGCPGLPADQRAAAELRFRMALEAALGGPAYVLPSLQGYMLAQSLQGMDAEDEDEGDDGGEPRTAPAEADGRAGESSDVREGEQDQDEDEDEDAMEQLIALWEAAEAQAIMAAMKPLGDSWAEAHFQIVPL